VIDWISVLVNSFWIFGLAILLAAFSHHYWLAPQQNRSLRQQLDQPAFLKFFWLGFIFITVGLAGTSQRGWETGVWIIMLMISIVNLYSTIRGTQ